MTPSVFLESRWNGLLQFRLINDETRAGSRTIPRRQLGYLVQFSPSRRFTQIGVNGTLGEEIDFENARAGNGPTINVSTTVNATDHLAFDLLQNQRWLNVDADGSVSRRLFTARVSRVKGTYTFTSRLFARGIAQYVSTTRAPVLYRDPVTPKSRPRSTAPRSWPISSIGSRSCSSATATTANCPTWIGSKSWIGSSS